MVRTEGWDGRELRTPAFDAVDHPQWGEPHYGRPGPVLLLSLDRLGLLPRRNYSAFFLRRRMMIPRKSTARMVQTNRTIFIVLISFPDKSYFG